MTSAGSHYRNLLPDASSTFTQLTDKPLIIEHNSLLGYCCDIKYPARNLANCCYGEFENLSDCGSH